MELELGQSDGRATSGAPWRLSAPICSTDGLPDKDRFDYWRELRARNIFGVTAELAKDRRPAFSGAMAALRVGSATVVEMHASAYQVKRHDADIERAPSDSLCIYQQLGGACWFETGNGGEFILDPGRLATSDADLPYATTPTTDHGFHLRLVKIPLARCKDLIARPAGFDARPLRATSISALLTSFLAAFVEQAPALKGAAAEIAVQTLAQLALAARGLAVADSEQGRDAVHTARLAAARDIIDRNLHRPLSAASVAAMLRISVRQLHLLFEPTATSFARYVLARRLERACLLLAQVPRRSVTDVAFAAGFESLSTFYRTFRAAYGISPDDFRQCPAGRVSDDPT